MHLEHIYQLFIKSTGVCTDTRTLQEGQLFFCLKGPNFNGNLFALQAIQKGALAVIADEVIPETQNNNIIITENCLKTLQDLACHHRKQWQTPKNKLIAITGSNGKTTTKEVLKAILSEYQSTYATEGNLNNHIGLPLTLLRLKPEHVFAIVEMGDNKPGDIEELCNIALPDLGVITNIGMDHIEFYKDMQGNANTKLELFDYLSKHNGVIFKNLADPYIQNYASDTKIKTWGTAHAEVFAQLKSQGATGTTFEINIKDEPNFACTSPMYGTYNLPNFEAATAVAHYLGCTTENITNGIKKYKPQNNRSQLIEVNNIFIISDAYNANPSSMLLALQDLDAQSGEKAVILGDMLELGSLAPTEHEAIGTLLSNKPHIKAILIGELMHHAFTAIKHSNKFYFQTTAEAMPKIGKLILGSQWVLLKGSRGMALEKLIPEITRIPNP